MVATVVGLSWASKALHASRPMQGTTRAEGRDISGLLYFIIFVRRSPFAVLRSGFWVRGSGSCQNKALRTRRIASVRKRALLRHRRPYHRLRGTTSSRGCNPIHPVTVYLKSSGAWHQSRRPFLDSVEIKPYEPRG